MKSHISIDQINSVETLAKVWSFYKLEYVIDYFKRQKINSKKFVNLLFPSMQVKKELFEIE